MAKYIVLTLLILILIPIVYHTFFNNPPLNSHEFEIKDQKYNLEIATTVPQKSKGLMDRTALCSNCGMLFIFDIALPQAFWMKNTLIPLDIIFLNKNGQVINIENAIPQPNTPDFKLTIYKSSSPAKYVIELNAGTAKQLNLQPGDPINLSSI